MQPSPQSLRTHSNTARQPSQLSYKNLTRQRARKLGDLRRSISLHARNAGLVKVVARQTDLAADDAAQESPIVYAASSTLTTSRFPNTSRASLIRGNLVGCLGSSIRRTSFSSQPSFRASCTLVIPDSAIARFKAAFAAICAGRGIKRSPRATLDALGISRPSAILPQLPLHGNPPLAKFSRLVPTLELGWIYECPHGFLLHSKSLKLRTVVIFEP